MSARVERSSINKFLGFSDRDIPASLGAEECPDVLNVDFSERAILRRNGYTRQHSNVMRNASARFDGQNDYLRIPHITAYVIGAGKSAYVGIAVQFNSMPTADVTIVSKGYGARTAATNCWRLEYRLTAGTGSLPAWSFTVYDTTLAAVRTYLIDDGDGVNVPPLRYLEFYGEDGAGAAKFKRWDTAGTATTASNVTKPSTWVASTDDITVGVSMSAAGTIGTDYAPASMAELRYNVATATFAGKVTTTNAYYSNELIPADYASIGGYWRFNDGTQTGTIVDLAATPNNANIPNNPAEWITSSSLAIGASALKFNGGQGWIRLDDISTTTTALTSQVFAGAPASANRWTLRALFTPLLAPNETTARDQTIVWAGGDSAIPGPVAIYVKSDKFEAKYRDGANTRTCTINSPLVSSLANKQVRIAAYRDGSGNGSFFLQICYVTGGVQTVASATSVACTSATAGSVSKHWAFGRHMQASSATADWTLPYASYSAAGDGSLYGILDSVQLVWHPASGTVTGITAIGIGVLNSSIMGPFTQFAQWGLVSQGASTVLDMTLDDGAGIQLRASAQVLGPPYNYGTKPWSAFLLPEPDDGIHWDGGLVDPYTPPECGGAFQFNRFISDGSVKKSLIVVNGSGLYEESTSAQTCTLIAGGLFQGPAGSKWTAAQYGQKLILAGPNKRRPMIYDGKGLRNLGIDPPGQAPKITVSGAAGSFNGSYYAYVTYRNKDVGAESNPGPGFAFTAAATNSITQIDIPVSPDPQVNQRRVYMTLVSGGDGSVAYALVDIDDNTTTSYTIPIAAPVTGGTSLLYLQNDVAPGTAIVAAYRDTIFAAGNSLYPTRVWRSAVGFPDSFDQSFLYVDLDSDQGNPITAMESLQNYVIAHFRNGYGLLFNTGDPLNPIGFTFANRDHGAIGAQCVARNNNRNLFLTARDVYETDGQTDVNKSSPQQPDLPSIQETMRSGLSAARLPYASCVNYRARKQYWISCTDTTEGATRNNLVLCLDYSQGETNRFYQAEPPGLWTKYDLPIDCLVEMEDHTDAANLYGVIAGFVCKLDTGAADGISASYATTCATVGTNPFNVSLVTSGVTRGIRFSYYRAADNTIYSSTVQRVGGVGINQDVYVYGYATLAATPPAITDVCWFGAIPCYADFILRGGSAMRLKRMKWVRVSCDTTSNIGYSLMRISTKADNPGRTFVYSGVSETIRTFLPTEHAPLISVGGNFNTMRIRVAECGLAAPSSSAPVPMIFGSNKLYALEWEYEILGGN